MPAREEVYKKIAEKMGPDFFLKKPPLVYGYDTYRLQKKAKNQGLFRKLDAVYREAPGVTCGPCGDVCCRESPDMYLLEFLRIWRHLKLERKDEALEERIVRRAVRWAFLHYFSDDIYCPFLAGGRCEIYEMRPLNCRLWALEDDDYYTEKAARARAAIEKQFAFFSDKGISPPLPAERLVLTKCNNITVDGGRVFSGEEIMALDLQVAFLHLSLIPHEAFRSLNFHLHFPGHIIMREVAAADYDNLQIDIAREMNSGDSSKTLEQLIESFGGNLPS